MLGGTLQPGTIQDLPLNGRNFMNLLQLRPGITIYPGGGAWTQTTNGLRPEENVYLLDGITTIEIFSAQSTINSVSLSGDAATVLPVDTIQEFNTQENPKAEFGWKPGAIVNIALKSGTNAMHGPPAPTGAPTRWTPRIHLSRLGLAQAAGGPPGVWRLGRRSHQERQGLFLHGL